MASMEQARSDEQEEYEDLPAVVTTKQNISNSEPPFTAIHLNLEI
jgi:hypothetical protein